MTILICDCNKTMPLDAAALRRALGPDARRGPIRFTRCVPARGRRVPACRARRRRPARRLHAGAAAVPRARRGDRRRRVRAERPIRFVNIRETAGWSKDAASAMPKIAALIAAAQLPDAGAGGDASRTRSAGRVLVIGDADRAVRAAADARPTSSRSACCCRDRAARLPQDARARRSTPGACRALVGLARRFRGRVVERATRSTSTSARAATPASRPARRTRSTSATRSTSRAAPASASACAPAARPAPSTSSARPASASETLRPGARPRPSRPIALHQPPQGYFHARRRCGAASTRCCSCATPSANSRSRSSSTTSRRSAPTAATTQIGCTACIDVCSAAAIRSDASMKGRTAGGGIVVEPHLCVGCGACTTVCPTRRAQLRRRRAPHDLGARLRTLLVDLCAAPAAATPRCCIHSQEAGARADRCARPRRAAPTRSGLPARVLPLEVWHTASVGIDLWLAAIAQGASRSGCW